MKPLKARPIIGDIAAQRLWGKGTATQRSVDILEGTFLQQRAFIEDPAKLKWALCTRRAAKSYSDGLALAKAALEHPDVSCLYIGLTRESAKRIIWKDVLKAINRRHKLAIRFNESELSARFPNGSVIYLVGADSNEDERQKLLGQKFVLVVIDEAQAFGIDLRQLVYGVLKPAVADYRGTIILTGTPGNLIKGLFFDVTTGREAGWSGHRWDTYANPYMKEQWTGEIADLKAASPLVVETPGFRQMYPGEWVIDLDKLVYRFNPDRNTFIELPTFHAGQWHYVLGVDLGYNDPTAFALCAYHDYDKTLYVLEAEKQPRLDVTSVAERIRGFSGPIRARLHRHRRGQQAGSRGNAPAARTAPPCGGQETGLGGAVGPKPVSGSRLAARRSAPAPTCRRSSPSPAGTCIRRPRWGSTTSRRSALRVGSLKCCQVSFSFQPSAISVNVTPILLRRFIRGSPARAQAILIRRRSSKLSKTPV